MSETTKLTSRRNRFTYNMNLMRDYCKDWDRFEILREVYANAVDADPTFSIEFEGSDKVTLTTATNPKLEHLFVLGCGTKSDTGETIGQFGEGVKIAALAATRRKNTSLVITGPMGQVTFTFKRAPGMDVPTLHAEVLPKLATMTFKVVLEARELLQIYKENFLHHDAPFGPVEKKEKAKGMRVYVRGILIRRCEENSLFDWNLQSLKLNRDRSMPDTYDLKNKVAWRLADLAGSPELMDKIIDNQNSYEAKACAHTYSSLLRDALTDAVKRKFGDSVALAASDVHINAIAARSGIQPLVMGELASALNIQSAAEVITKIDRLDQSDKALTPDADREIRQLSDLLGIPITLTVHKDDGKTMGAARGQGNGAQVWINETLLTPGMRFERLRTILHELGHIKGGTDVTLEFESSLDWIAAKLAERVL